MDTHRQSSLHFKWHWMAFGTVNLSNTWPSRIWLWMTSSSIANLKFWQVTFFCASVERVKLNTNSTTWRYCTMPIAIALLMWRKKRYMIISDKHGVIWNETYRYLGLLLNCDGKKIIVSSKLPKFYSLAERAITILRPSSESVNVLKDWKECIRLAVKSIFTTESHICGILKRRLGKHSSPNEIAPRRFVLGMLYKRSRKRSLQFSLSWTQFIKNWLSAQMRISLHCPGYNGGRYIGKWNWYKKKYTNQ